MFTDGQPEPPLTMLSSTYPPAPMEFANLFTNENLKSGKAPQPPKIIKDSYTSFGRVIDPNEVLIRSLESQGLQRLYPIEEPSIESGPRTSGVTTSVNINNHKKELKKLNHSILIAYLDLLEILVKAPNTQIQIEQLPPAQSENLDEQPPQPVIIYKTLREQKLEDMELLFINMHHLINELRPHQARDNIRCILEMQRQQRADTARKFKAHLFKIMVLLRSCIQSVNESASKSNTTASDQTLFMEDLNSLISNAGRLTIALDRFDSTTTNKKPLLPKLTNGVVNNNEEDVEMKNEAVESSLAVVTKKTVGYNSSKRVVSEANRNCEVQDLILCDLIDEFLVKGGDF